jgi:hypothetical protein
MPPQVTSPARPPKVSNLANSRPTSRRRIRNSPTPPFIRRAADSGTAPSAASERWLLTAQGPWPVCNPHPRHRRDPPTRAMLAWGRGAPRVLPLPATGVGSDHTQGSPSAAALAINRRYPCVSPSTLKTTNLAKIAQLSVSLLPSSDVLPSSRRDLPCRSRDITAIYRRTPKTNGYTVGSHMRSQSISAFHPEMHAI